MVDQDAEHQTEDVIEPLKCGGLKLSSNCKNVNKIITSVKGII